MEFTNEVGETVLVSKGKLLSKNFWSEEGAGKVKPTTTKEPAMAKSKGWQGRKKK